MTNWRLTTIRAKLYALVAFSTGTLLLVVLLAWWLLYTYRIDGPLYRQIKGYAGIVSELEPATLAITRPYHTVLRLSLATDANEISQLETRLAEQESAFRGRVDFYRDS